MSRLLAAVALVAASCGPPTKGTGSKGIPEALKGLPEHRDPPLDLTDDTDMARARLGYDALAADDANRPALRRELWAAYQARIAARLAGDSRDMAFRFFILALEMWHPSELQGGTVTDLDLTVATAQDLYERFSATGHDLEALTALTVLIVALPDRHDELVAAYEEISAFSDSLESFKGRRIAILEEITTRFPARWPEDRLIAEYAVQQAAFDAVVAAGSADLQAKIEDLYNEWGPSLIRPTWALIRAYTMTGRIDEAITGTDYLEGKLNDQPGLRGALKDALEGGSGKDWGVLMVAYMDQENGLVDFPMFFRLAELAQERVPKGADPMKLAADVARATKQTPLAIRWAEAAWAVDKTDRLVADMLAELYLVRLADNLFSERIDAARAQLVQIEAFHADAAPRWKEPLDTTLADVHLQMGRGLYSVGQVDEAILYLQKAQKADPSAAALEQLATIAMKKGRFADAARDFDAAVAMPQDTPLDSAFQKARLERLAGEAYLGAGDRLRAQTLFHTALTEWTDLLDARPNERVQALVWAEIGRLHFQLGDTGAALEAFAAAIDADTESAETYSDVIAFLVARGYYDAAADAYVRALGREEVSEYIKVYMSLWMVQLARLQGREPDKLARRYLGTLTGDRWYVSLGRYVTGEMTYDELFAKADTPGKRAETFFYGGFDRYIQGDKAGGDAFMQDVLDTEMLGFFEYDMATYFLANGPPTKR